MSLCNDTTTTMLVSPTGYNGGNNSGFGWGGDWASWIILFLIFGMFGWGGFGGFGGGYGNGGQALTRGELCQDMNFQDVKNGVTANGAAMQDGFRNVDNAICTLGYQNAQLVNGVQMQAANEFRGIDNAVCTLGYNTQQGFNNLGGQLSSCCCDIKGGIKDGVTQSIMNTNALSQQIQQCCCDNEKIAMQNRFDMAQGNCATLQAIDKVGDRIIDYLAADKMQTLRDENQALRLAASQSAQNNYIGTRIDQAVSTLRPCPVPAYITCNPWATQASYGSCGNYGVCA